MILHTKIMATLWILTVVMWLLFWAMPDHWMSECSSKNKFMQGFTQTALLVSAVTFLDTVLYVLVWVWG